MPERDNYICERNQSIAAFFNSLASLVKKAETLVDVVIEQEKDDPDSIPARRRPGRMMR
jgi:hypothetical protein